MDGRDPDPVSVVGPEVIVAPADEAGGWPWPSACAGGLLGVVGAWAIGFEPWRVVLYGVVGAYAFAFLGAASVDRFRLLAGRRRAASTARADLWDPWLDEGGLRGRDPGPAPGEVAPARAPVRPRVLSPDGASFCLEDEVPPFTKAFVRGAIRIDGPYGSGKSTALGHLLATLPEELGVRVLDDPDPATLAEHAASAVVVYAAEGPVASKHLATFMLAPWGEDERIEYLLGRARERCGSVMARLKAADDRDLAEGSPELWRVVLDRMIADDSVEGVRPALRRELASRLEDGALRERVGDHCLWKMDVPVQLPPEAAEMDLWRARDEALHRLIRHQAVRLLLAADRLVDELAKGDDPCAYLSRRLSRDLVVEAGWLVRDRPEVAARLASVVAEGDPRFHAMAASLLHAARIRWRPTRNFSLRLSYAYLDRADWMGVVLSGAEMIRVEMEGASLCKAMLDNARIDNARFGRAKLKGASLLGLSALEADLREADLTGSHGDGAHFIQANLGWARLDSGSFRGAWFHQANLSHASFKGADLTRASFERATLDGADFSGANLESANLKGLDFSKAVLAGASFHGTDLAGSNLEAVDLAGAIFPGATLRDAHLTGSIMPGANFRKANLQGAYLAEVAWEGARLDGADLRGASFHMGSSRSGLVNSPIASEGSRTGFYTDDFDEQDFKSPEEIRKADLRGVDLTGANLDGVDLYLVDLRGATLDADQALHARRCGAILQDRGNRGD